jgi:small subunit ribosomal protein S2
MAQVSMRDLLQAGAHFGHQTRFWNPKMGVVYLRRPQQDSHHQPGAHRQALNDALTYANGLAARKNKVLFVGTKRAASEIVVNTPCVPACPLWITAGWAAC